MKHYPDCPICHQGGRVVYGRLMDARFGVPGSFDIRSCPSCGLWWTDPRPDPEEMALYYVDFYAKATPHVFPDNPLRGGDRRLFARARDFIRQIILCGYFGYRQVHADHRFCGLGQALGRIPVLRFKASWDLGAFFPEAPKGRDTLYMDVGCGEGGQLELMRFLGWAVRGVEPHPDGAATVAKKGIRVHQGFFEDVDIDEKSVDVIAMNHVLEHVRDPRFIIEKCWRALKKGGRLVVRVPNNESFGSRIFKRHLYSLEVPRHLYHFSEKSLKALFSPVPFEELSMTTLSRATKSIYDHSVCIARDGKTDPLSAPRQRGRWFFSVAESLLCLAGFRAGEEIELVAVK